MAKGKAKAGNSKDGAVPLAALGGMGKEIPGDDLTNDADLSQTEAATMDMDELERQIDRDFVAGQPSESAKAVADELLPESEPETKAKPEPEPEPEPAEPEERVETAGSETETPETTEPEYDEAAEERAALLRRLEMAEIRSEKAEGNAEKFQMLHDKITGVNSNLMKKLREFEGGVLRRPEPADTEDDFVAEPQRPVARTPSRDPELAAELEEIRSERIERALRQEGANLYSENQKFWEGLKTLDAKEPQTGHLKSFIEDLQQFAAANHEEVKEALYGNNARTSARLARGIYRSAFADARIRLLERQEAAAEERRVKYLGELRGKKQSAGATVTDGGEAAVKPKKVNPATMPLDDLERLVDEEYGVHEGAGTEII